MSKKVLGHGDNEIKKLDLTDISSSNTKEEENQPFLKMTVSDKDSCLLEDSKVVHTTTTTSASINVPKYSISAQNSITNLSQEKRKIEKTHSGPSRIPSFRLSTPNSQGYTRVSYANEKKQDYRKMEKQSSSTPPLKRESSSIFSRPSKSSIKHSPLLRLNREEKKTTPTSKLPVESQYVRARNLSPEGISRLRGIGAVRNLRVGHLVPLRLMDRPTQYHTFPTDDTDVREIEKKLLQLMEDFEAGNLRAFGKDSRLRQMEEIREQQERLAKLHFEVGADQELYSPLSEDGLKNAEDNMKKLMSKLAHLSESIENLHSNSHLERKSSTTERKASSSALHVHASSAAMENSFDTAALHTTSPLILHHNPNKTVHTPPPPLPPLSCLPSQNNEVKDQKLSTSNPLKVCASRPATVAAKKSVSKLPGMETTTTQLSTTLASTIVQQKGSCSPTPASCSSVNITHAKLNTAHKIPQTVNAIEPEFSQKFRNASQSVQSINKKFNGES